MKIGFTSDLHIDYNREYDIENAIINTYKKYNLSTLMIAGDISNSTKTTKEFMNRLWNKGLSVYAIYGNHDYYTLEKGFHEDRDEMSGFPIIFEDWGIIADTGWYNYTWHKFGSIGQLKKGKVYGNGSIWPDHRFIVWPDDGGAEWFCQESIRKMRIQNQLLDICEVKNKIIMTHMVPHYELLEQNMEFIHTNPFFGSEDLSKFIKEVAPTYSIFGHTHFTKDKVIGNTHYICSPVGYNFEWGNRNAEQIVENRMFVLEV